MASIGFSQVRKRFSSTIAVDNVSLNVPSGSMFTLLGPSGCGKTTTLRIIAGLERADSGQVSVDGRILDDPSTGIFVPPEKRRMGMVFQSYAIWPHMTVYENVVFPLQMARTPKSEHRERVLNALDLVGLSGLHDRPAPALSGGQQQRVSLARALVGEPEVLLLDEPLSNLDARLRDRMRFELREIQQRLKITGVFVTHDQQEAMVLSDEVILMNAGHVEQQGHPLSVYQSPKTRFAMDFMGEPNYVDATIKEQAGGLTAVGVSSSLITAAISPSSALKEGQSVHIAFRPEDAEVVSDTSGDVGGWPATIVTMAHVARNQLEYILDVDGIRVRAHGHMRESRNLIPGGLVKVIVSPEAICIWPHSADDDIGNFDKGHLGELVPA